DFRTEQAFLRRAEIGGAVLDLRQHGGRDAQYVEKLVVPFVPDDVVDQRARGVGGVGGVGSTPGQPPDQEGVYRAGEQLALLRPPARTLHVIEDPRHLGAREIGVEQQAGLFREFRLQPLFPELLAEGGGAAVLPDDGVVDRAARGLVPDHRGLALVGDADGRDVGSLQLRLLQRLLHRPHRGFPKVLRVVLDPAGSREMLRKLLLADGDDAHPVVEDDGAGGGGSLVDGEDVLWHGRRAFRGQGRRGTGGGSLPRPRAYSAVALTASF